ncbi:MAG TPA: hypothetical protein VFM69_11675 [Pricia sp.]|nr:hypothetical protein [Pricia sp.]
MDKPYFEEQSYCTLIKTKLETVRFLQDYSKSLQMMKIENLHFETHLN